MILAPDLALAVGALRPGATLNTQALANLDPKTFAAFLRSHGVAALFRSRVREVFGPLVLPPALEQELATLHRQAVAHSMMQERAVEAVAEALNTQNSPWLLWRGLQLAHLLYEDVGLRAMGDIDLLVPPKHRRQAQQALERAGFSVHKEKRLLTHEITLQGHGVWLDLHWRLFRPGRARIPLANWVFSNSQHGENFPQPNPTATLTILLLHTALTEHVTRRLIRAVDVDRCIRRCAIDWDAVITLCTRAGLKTAAWTMLTWTHALFETPVPQEVWRALSPGPVRSRYLRTWLAYNPGHLYDTHPQRVRLGFSLALQDGS